MAKIHSVEPSSVTRSDGRAAERSRSTHYRNVFQMTPDAERVNLVVLLGLEVDETPLLINLHTFH